MAEFVSFNAPRVAENLSTGRSATAADSGPINTGALTQGIDQLSNKLVAANQRIQNRNDTILTAAANDSFATATDDELRRTLAEDNIIMPSVLKSFGEKNATRIQDALKNFEGTADARANLTAQLTKVAGESTRLLAKASNAAGVARVTGRMTKGFSAITQQAIESGDINAAFAASDAEAASASGALPDPVIQEKLDAQRQTIVTMVFDNAVGIDGDIEVGRTILETKGIETLVDPKTLLRMRGDIISADREVRKGAIQGQQELEKTATILGKKVSELTPAERSVISGVNPGQTPGEKLTAINKGLADHGLPALSPEESQRVITGFKDSDNARKFTQSGARDIAATNGPKILAGDLDEQGVIDFIASTTVLTQKRQVIQADGSMVTLQGSLTQASKEALTKLGVTATGAPIDGTEPKVTTNGDEGAPILTAEAPVLEFEDTVYGASFVGTGLVSALKSVGAGIPGLGETEFFRNDKVVAARQLLTAMQNELVNVLRFSNRADAERKEINNEISITPNDTESPQKFRAKLVAIDDVLSRRQKAAFNLLNGGTVIGSKQKAELREFVNKAGLFRDKLGIPRQFKSFEEARKAELQPGDVIIVRGQFVTFGAKGK